MGKRKKEMNPFAETPKEKTQDPLQSEILDRLQRVRFKRKFFGGVDEADVWKKIAELNSLYEHAFLMNGAKAPDCAEDTDAETETEKTGDGDE